MKIKDIINYKYDKVLILDETKTYRIYNVYSFVIRNNQGEERVEINFMRADGSFKMLKLDTNINSDLPEILPYPKSSNKESETIDILKIYIDRQLKKIEDCTTHEKKSLEDLKNEVNAHLKLCDNYDQKIEILAKYGIIDKENKKIL